jgi:uncharacterized protein
MKWTKKTTPNASCDLRPGFWEKHRLEDLNPAEWEALCDGCGKCCLRKLEDADTGEVFYTNVVCRLLDTASCRCGQYALRKQLVADCVSLTPLNIENVAYWLPHSCAYRLLFLGEKLYPWHPLISGDPNSVHAADVSVSSKVLSEDEVDEDDLEDYIIEGMA